MQLSRKTLVALLLIGGVFIVAVAAHYFLFTRPYPGHNDFLTPWEASRSHFYEGLDPYGQATSVNIQQRIYGRAALPDEFPNHYAYPFYTLYFTWPLIHFDYNVASAIWMVLLEAMMIGSLLLLFDLYHYRPKPLMILLLILFLLFSYSTWRGLVAGQMSHLVFFLQVVVLWAIFKQHDTLAGITLAATTLKPQMVLLFVPFIFLWAVMERRWRLLLSFIGVFGILFVSSFALQPNWLAGMQYQVELYPSYIEVSTPAWVVMQYMLHLGIGAEWVVNIIFYGVMLWAWYKILVEHKRERFMWTALMTITVTHLVAFRTATPHFVVFVIPLVFYLKRYTRRYKGRTFIVMVALFLLPWVYFLLTISDTEFEHPTNLLPLPVLTFVVLVLTRKLWWSHKPQLLESALEDGLPDLRGKSV